MAAATQVWLAELRVHFGATRAMCFDCDLDPPGARFVGDPPGADVDASVLEALRSTLRGRGPGDAVAWTALMEDDAPEARVDTAVAVRCGPDRFMGLLVRCAGRGRHDSATQRGLAAILWHLYCADETAQRTRAMSLRLLPSDIVDLLPLACVITDVSSRALDRNDAFSRFMQQVGMRIHTGRLRFEDPYLQESWRVCLGEALATAAGQSLLVTGEQSHWRVHLAPFHGALSDQDVVGQQLVLAIAERHGGEVASVESSTLPETSHPLTRAETEVLAALLQGHSAKVIAHARGASVNTVRSQITTILEKTGHNNQKSLMAAFAPSGFRPSMVSGFASLPAAQLGKRK